METHQFQLMIKWDNMFQVFTTTSIIEHLTNYKIQFFYFIQQIVILKIN